MEKIDILLWIVTSGFGLMLVMWNALNKRIDSVESNLTKRIDFVESSLTMRIEKLDEKVTDIDRRLCRLEGAFASKDCCLIKDDRQLKKAE